MSTEYHRPTHTFEAGAYNATQVRLYGIPAQAMIGTKGSPALFSAEDMTVSIEAKETSSNESQNALVSFLAFRTKMMGLMVLATASESSEEFPLSAGVIYGYAYEGNCYDLAKPKIMLIEAMPGDIPSDDCGFEAKQPEPGNYRVWVVDKLDKCAEIELNQGFVEQIVLEANLPGKRSPRSYSATMQVAHRSGRLTE
jgi:hypothetical protein